MRELIQLDLIDPNPWQPRTSDDPEHISNLAVSIAKDGLLQPPAARLMPDGRYQLAFGHSRYKAFGYLYLMAQTDFGWLTAHGIDAIVEQFAWMPLEIVTLNDEAMYRHAISENVQRKDLSPIEEAAAMKRAMDEFSYTSDQVGALFGKTGATVRGMVRYLELPENAQTALDHGEISQNGARALLSMLRVAPGQVVAGAVSVIRERADQETPEIVIRGILDRQLGIVRLWDDTRDGGRPHAGGVDQWPLDAKKFPNQYLPALTRDGLITALEITENRIKSDIGHDLGDVAVRLLGQRLLASSIDADHELAGKLAVLINPPACTACPAYTRIGGVHYCGFRSCYQRKQKAWSTEQLEQRKKQIEQTVFTDKGESTTKANVPTEVEVFAAASETSIEEDETETEIFETAATTPAAAPVAVAIKPANPLTDDPYDFDQCTITMQLTMLPDDGNEGGREVMVGVRNHADPYIMGIFRLGELPLPDGINSLLNQLREQLPARELAKAMRDAEVNKK